MFAGQLHGQPVAIKYEVIDNPDGAAGWTKTAVLHMRAKCPHIILMHGAVVRKPTTGGSTAYYSIMERLAGTLTKLLLTRGGAHHDADMELRLALLADVAGGLAHLHAASVIHGDVKPDNVLLSSSTPPVAKLTDLGSSVLRREGAEIRETMMGERGTLMYMDPRLFNPAAAITAASDVYSFGVMAWQLLSGLVPYEADLIATLPPSATGLQTVDALRRHVLGGGRPPVAVLVECGVPPSIVTLVESCWAHEQASRPTMAAAQQALRAAAAVFAPLAYAWDDELELPNHGTFVTALALLPGGRLASGDAIGVVRLWDAARGEKALAVLQRHAGIVRALAALPDGRRLAAAMVNGKVSVIAVWDTTTMPPTRCVTIDCDSGVNALVVLHDGRLAAGCTDGRVRLLDITDSAGAGAVPASAATLEGYASGVAALAVLPAGALASGAWDGTVRLWDVGAQACVATLKGHTSIVSSLAVLADGRLASGSTDCSVRLWDVATRACVGVLAGHSGNVSALTALPDGRLASGSADSTIRVWDTRLTTAAANSAGGGAAFATPVEVLEGHTTWVLSLAPLPGGRLASGSGDGTVRLWRLPPVHDLIMPIG